MMNRPLGCAFWAKWLLANVLSWALLWTAMLAVLGVDNGGAGLTTPAAVVLVFGIVVLGCLVLVLPQGAVLGSALSLPNRWTKAYLAGMAVGSIATLAILLGATFIEAFSNVQEVALLGLAVAWLLNVITQWLVIDRHAPRAGWLVAANAVNLASGGFLTLAIVFAPLAMAAWNLGDSSAEFFAYFLAYALIGAVGGTVGGLCSTVLTAPLLAHYHNGQLLPSE